MRETAPEWSGRAEYVPHRAFTLLRKLARDKAIDANMLRAGLDLHDAIVKEAGHSEGVVDLTGSRGGDPVSKADRMGRKFSGFKFDEDGTIGRARKQSRRNEHELEDMLRAACGGWRTDGSKWCNLQHCQWLMATVMDSEDMATLKALSQRMGVYAPDAKQGPPYALAHLHVWLGRLARYLAYAK